MNCGCLFDKSDQRKICLFSDISKAALYASSFFAYLLFANGDLPYNIYALSSNFTSDCLLYLRITSNLEKEISELSIDAQKTQWDIEDRNTIYLPLFSRISSNDKYIFLLASATSYDINYTLYVSDTNDILSKKIRKSIEASFVVYFQSMV